VNNSTVTFNSVTPSNYCNVNTCSYNFDLGSGDYKWQVGIYETYTDGSYAYLLETEFINFIVAN